jgi:hypothetical protein
MMKTLSLHMQANNGVSTNMGIVYDVRCSVKYGYYDGTVTDAYQRISKAEYCHCNY